MDPTAGKECGPIFSSLVKVRGLECSRPFLVSQKCQSARGHSNKTKQDFGLTGFPKASKGLSRVSEPTTGKPLLHSSISACVIDGQGCKK